MASIVLYTKGDKTRYKCSACMDKSNWLSQGRSQEYADERIRRKLKAKGCLRDSKSEVFRLNSGERIYRCPRAICNETDSIMHFTQNTEIEECGLTHDAHRMSWKWHQVHRSIRYEIFQVRKLATKKTPSFGGRK